jgi:hypothetical protein
MGRAKLGQYTVDNIDDAIYQEDCVLSDQAHLYAPARTLSAEYNGCVILTVPFLVVHPSNC